MRDSHVAATPLLWTGGWDSTFRLLNLLLQKRRPVQPYYIVESLRRRPAVAAEREAMRRIRQALLSRYPEAAARLADTIECPLAQIAQSAELTCHYEQCLKYGFIGGQYEWLARYCLQHDFEAMELSIHRDDKARRLIEPLIHSSRDRLDPRFAGDSRYELFKRFRFPLFDLTKEQMRAAARVGGFEELMQLTWFCHKPRRGEACGTCNPCIYTIEEGLGDRVPLAGRIRYRLRVIPRIRHWLVSRPALYMRARSLYRRLRGLARRPAPA